MRLRKYLAEHSGLELRPCLTFQHFQEENETNGTHAALKGEIPAYKIYEDNLTLAFLDIHPVHEGHTLVIPKLQIDQLWDLPDEVYNAVMLTTHKVAIHLRKVLGVRRVGVKVVGTDVPHAHIQLIPFNTPNQFAAVQDMNSPVNYKELKYVSDRLTFERNVI